MLRSVRPTSFAASAVVTLFALLSLLPLSCSTQEPQPSSYFDTAIAPILTTACVRTNTGVGCHVADAKGNAFGNLDVSSYEALNHRRDLLLSHGPYGQPALLVKNIPNYTVNYESFDGVKVPITTDIKHVGGAILDPTGTAYQILRRWIDNGATQNNSGQPPTNLTRLSCASGQPPSDPGFDPTHDPTGDPGFTTFQNQILPIVKSTCSASNCHGVPTNVLQLFCGNTDAEVRWDFWALSQYVTDPPSNSQIVSRPLAGGTYHEGGILFANVNDPGYKAFLQFATDRGAAQFNNLDPNFAFFAHRVQPVLVRKGCAMVQCHSPAMFHDYRLRGGTGGNFSYFATLRNYKLSLLQLNLESDDVSASRLVRKNLLRPEVAGLPPPTPLGGPSGPAPDAGGPPPTDGGGPPPADAGSGGDGGGGGGPATGQPLGLLHRGGPLFEDFGQSGPSGPTCDAPGYDYDNGDLDTIPAFCLIREWHKRERAAAMLAPLSAVVYVRWAQPPAAPDRAQDFDVFAGGAELHYVPASLTPTGDVQLTGADQNLNLGTLCGLSGSLDIRRPAVSWDGSKIAFAARSDPSQPLQIYEMDSMAKTCSKHPLNDLNMFPLPSQCSSPPAGLLVHNFDPSYAPDGRLVFASTRGNLADVQGNFDYCGPQRTPADPSKPNANLYVYEPDPANMGQFHLRQLTYVLNMERYPSFMADGRIIFTAEKREPNFYELALRRENLDGGDYHPLYAQRGTIGYYEATQVVELADKNFAAIFSNPKAQHAGGALVVFNRSIGVDFHSTNPADYLVDNTCIDPTSQSFPEDGTMAVGLPTPAPSASLPNFFLHSLRMPDPGASGNPGTPGTIYRSPSALPDGKMLVSIAGSTDPATFDGVFDVYTFDPQTGSGNKLISGNGGSAVEAVAVYGRGNHGVFQSTYDEPNGHTTMNGQAGVADVTILSMPVLASLLFQNTPTGRLVESDLSSFDVYEEMPPDSASPPASFIANDMMGWTGNVYVRRRQLGHVQLQSDGSAHIALPGGVPIVLKLADTQESQAQKLPRFQREEMEFAPGEVVNQAFNNFAAFNTTGFFNSLCGQCHAAVSGHAIDVAVQPDILTQASMVAARGTSPTALDPPPRQFGSNFVGPPASP